MKIDSFTNCTSLSLATQSRPICFNHNGKATEAPKGISRKTYDTVEARSTTPQTNTPYATRYRTIATCSGQPIT